MTVGPGGSQLLYLCLLIRGPLYCNQNTADKKNYETAAFNLFKGASYNISDRLPVADQMIF